jgi:phosphoribosylformylglycinamidine cyclo-ligase
VTAGEAREYARAGVDLEAADRAKARIAQLVEGTRTEHSLGLVGGFGGMVRVPAGLAAPTLVLSTDGVGTKVLVALRAGRFDTIGEDLVNHCVNDILVHGATPLAFMDYIAGAELEVAQIGEIVEGIARGCRDHGMALAGGETAQMPGLYQAGTFDLAGTIVGVVEERRAIHGTAIAPGDSLLAYAASGLHTNGYTLARRVIFDRLRLELGDTLDGTDQSVGEALLAVHRSYYRSVFPVLDRVHGLAHITGGGIAGNLVRILPQDCVATVDPGTWELPPLFRFLQQAGQLSTQEMREVFNLGVGLVAVLPPDAVAAAQTAAAEAGVTTWVMGEIQRGTRAVRFARP